MQIQIIDVGTPNTIAAKNGRSYQSIEVTYKGPDGRASSKKLMSFSNPSVFKAVSQLSKGDTIDVTTQKDDAGYWQWTAVNEAGSAPSAQAPVQQTSSASATRVTGSNYETKEERAARQELIVRQSSLSNAIAILTVGAKSLKKEDVFALAQELNDWVFNKHAEKAPDPKVSGSFDDLEDDFPE